MKIGILGTGLMGTALGTVWARQNNEIIFSYSRNVSRLETAARQAGKNARAGSLTEAVQTDVILMAVPWHRVTDVLSQAGSLADKIVISCMLPMTDDDSGLAVGFDSSGAEVLAEQTGARVIGTFNTVWSNVITAQHDTPPSMFYVGDDEEAKNIGETLIRDAGFEPIDAGSLSAARLLEPFGLLMGQMGFAYNPLVAYRFLKPLDR